MKRLFGIHYNVSGNPYGFRGNLTELSNAQELNLIIFTFANIFSFKLNLYIQHCFRNTRRSYRSSICSRISHDYSPYVLLS